MVDLAGHVCAGIDASLREFSVDFISYVNWDTGLIGLDLRKCHLESLLNRLQHLLILLTTHKGDGETLGSETSSTTNTMEVRISIARKIVVDS